MLDDEGELVSNLVGHLSYVGEEFCFVNEFVVAGSMRGRACGGDRDRDRRQKGLLVLH